MGHGEDHGRPFSGFDQCILPFEAKAKAGARPAQIQVDFCRTKTAHVWLKMMLKAARGGLFESEKKKSSRSNSGRQAT